MKINKTYIIFIYIALIVGTIFIFLTPPFQSPDEDSHFKKAYIVSKGKIVPKTISNKQGYYLPNDMLEYISEKNSKMSNRDWKYTYTDFYYDNFLSVDYTKTTFVDFSTQGALSFAYLPAAIGIFIAKRTSKIFIGGACSTAYMLYFARFFNLLFYVFIISLAIKKTPILKKTMSFISLLPMSLFLGSMVTYDGFLISLSLLTISLILNLIYNEEQKFSLKYIIYFSIVGFILIRVKFVYSISLLLLLMIPKEKFKDKKKIKNAIYVILGVFIIYLLGKIPSLFANNVSNLSQNVIDQVTFIKENPIKFIGVLLSNINNQKWTHLIEMIGVLGLLDTYLPSLIILLLVFFLFILSISELSLSNIKIDYKTKILALLAFVISTLGIFAAMYVYWTPEILEIGGNQVTGVQGRYFIPVLILPLMIFSNDLFKKNKILVKIMNLILNNYILISILGLIVGILMLLFRYWC